MAWGQRRPRGFEVKLGRLDGIEEDCQSIAINSCELMQIFSHRAGLTDHAVSARIEMFIEESPETAGAVGSNHRGDSSILANKNAGAGRKERVQEQHHEVEVRHA